MGANKDNFKRNISKLAAAVLVTTQVGMILPTYASVGTFPTILGATTAVVEAGTSFDFSAGIIASDLEDGELTFTVDSSRVNLKVPGVYTARYSTVDLQNNKITVLRTITVVDRIAAEITGVDSVTVEFGSEFDSLLGVRAVDTVDGDITTNIRVVGDVDTMTPGEYTLTYTVADAAGNVATITRVVTVTEQFDTTSPTIEGANNM
ncbi:MAG: immunoglobulin-like domain-containing protein, partial [Culicoidibacterales bacterium]